MSRIVTFEQAKKLKDIGFDYSDGNDQTYYHQNGELVTYQYWDYYNDCPDDPLDSDIPAPTVSDALDWVREEKRVACGVHPYAIYEDMPDGDQHFVKWGYKYVAFQGLSEWQNMNKEVFDTHPLASSALLDAVLTYLENTTDL